MKLPYKKIGLLNYTLREEMMFLANFFGYKNCWGDWIKISDYHIYDDFTHRMENESIPDFNIRRTEWRKELDKVSVKKITVTIPKGWIEKAKKLKQ
jgi:hypothetical protein